MCRGSHRIAVNCGWSGHSMPANKSRTWHSMLDLNAPLRCRRKQAVPLEPTSVRQGKMFQLYSDRRLLPDRYLLRPSEFRDDLAASPRGSRLPPHATHRTDHFPGSVPGGSVLSDSKFALKQHQAESIKTARTRRSSRRRSSSESKCQKL